jgi:hypothetical protein
MPKDACLSDRQDRYHTTDRISALYKGCYLDCQCVTDASLWKATIIVTQLPH